MQRSVLSNDTIGHNVLQAHKLPTHDYWYWLGVCVLLAYSVLFNYLLTLALAYLNRESEKLSCFAYSCLSLLLNSYLNPCSVFQILMKLSVFFFCSSITALTSAQAVLRTDDEDGGQSFLFFSPFSLKYSINTS